MKDPKKLAALLAALLITMLSVQGAAAQGGAPIAQNISLSAYRNIPCTATLKATDRSGSGLSYALVDAPKHGTVSIETDGARFTYTPQENRVGSDSFTYVAVDGAGNTSQPATVRVTVERPDTAVTYADMDGNAAYTAAVLDRLLDVTDVDLADYGTSDVWSAQAAANLISVSVLPSGSFSDTQLSRALTRAEAAELLSAALTLTQQKPTGLFARLFG